MLRTTFHTIARRCISTSTRAAAADSAAAASTVAATPVTPVRSLSAAASAAGCTSRIIRLADDIAKNSKPTFENGKWHKAKLSARDMGLLRKVDLFSGGTFSEFERPLLARIQPVVLKGKKREKVVADRKKRIIEAMKDMDERVEEHWRSERARRVRPTFYQQVTGKKPSGVIAAEEAMLKERKEKLKEREKARQAALQK